MGDGPVFVRVFTLPGAYLPSEATTLRKDLEKILTPYGTRHRHDNVRHGYAIGTGVGLIRCEPIDRLALLHHSGGICFDDDLAALAVSTTGGPARP